MTWPREPLRRLIIGEVVTRQPLMPPSVSGQTAWDETVSGPTLGRPTGDQDTGRSSVRSRAAPQGPCRCSLSPAPGTLPSGRLASFSEQRASLDRGPDRRHTIPGMRVTRRNSLSPDTRDETFMLNVAPNRTNRPSVPPTQGGAFQNETALPGHTTQHDTRAARSKRGSN